MACESKCSRFDDEVFARDCHRECELVIALAGLAVPGLAMFASRGGWARSLEPIAERTARDDVSTRQPRHLHAHRRLRHVHHGDQPGRPLCADPHGGRRLKPAPLE